MKQRVVCVFLEPWGKGASELELFAEACLRFTPQVAVHASEAVFLEIGGSLELFSEQTILARLGVLAQRFGFTPRVAVSADAPAALALAKHGSRSLASLPVAALVEYASPFYRDAALEKKVRRMIETLVMLGLKNLEDFARLPSRTIAVRFGEYGLELSRRVCRSLAGELDLLWPRFRPTEAIFERLQLFDGGSIAPCAELEPLLFAMRGMADRAMARLRGRGLRMASLEIEAELDRRGPGRQISWTLRLPVPQGSVAGLMPILKERLAADFNRAPLGAPVAAIALRVIETAPGHERQQGLFDHEKDGEQAERLDGLMGRLCARLGNDRAFVAKPVNRHLPERAWGAVAIKLDEPVGNVDNSVDIPARPARLLKKPQHLEKRGDVLAGEQKAWQVLEWQGPERIACEWWRDPSHQGFNRDYYRALTHTGEQLWIFSVPGRSGFYLHGYFD